MSLGTKLCLSLLLLALSAPSCARSENFPNVTSFKQLWVAFSAANNYALKCNGTEGCLGEVVNVTLKFDVLLPQALFPLNSNAYMVIRGDCPNRKGGACVVDGKNTWKAFQSGITSPGAPGKLEIINLIFQKVKGGVIDNIFCAIVADKINFRNNINGVITNVGFKTGSPPMSFTNCRFLGNNGTVIKSGNPIFGRKINGGGLTIRRSQFRDNAGGAAILTRAGKSIFENVKFIGNYAPVGGAVAADQTDVIFRGTEFKNNKATKGGGGAVLGKSGKFSSVKFSFCTCSFNGNSAPKDKASSDLLFTAQGRRVDVAFCDTKIPPASVLPKEPNGSVTVGAGKSCFKKYC